MKKILIVSFVVLLIPLLYVLLPHTNVNYDMTIYLPDDAQSKIGMDILVDEFGESSMIQVMIEDISVSDVLLKQTELSSINHVVEIIWLDDYVDLNSVPIEFVPRDVLASFYVDGDALLTIVFDQDVYDRDLETSITEIKTLLDDYTIHIRGEILANIEARNLAANEIVKVMFLIVPVVILLLLVSSHAWFEPLLILITLGIAIVFNLITNGLLPHVSFITQTMSLALQLALSIDYALFMIHRYYEERETSESHEAAKQAIMHSIKPITISALTTIAGFAALSFMKYSIGLDMALVLSKGIIFSYLGTMIILPILLIWFDRMLIKTKHRVFFPDFKLLAKFQYKARYVLVVIFILLLGAGFYIQQNASYLFGTSDLSESTSEINIDLNIINDTFGPNHQLVILVPNETVDQEVTLVSALMSLDHVLSVNTLVTQVDPMVPRNLLPTELVQYYVGESYTRMIVQTDLYLENDALYQFSSDLHQVIADTYDESYIVGQAAALSDIKDSIESQGSWIMLLTVFAVGLIVGLIFKSWKIPLILVSVILTAIWINISILAVTNISIVYIGYLIVMSIQLGATIDYAVLLTHRYLEERKTKDQHQAIYQAFTKSSISIIISGMILTVAGLVEGIFSEIEAITQIGLLLGKGAFLSLVTILLFLPVILLILDRFIVPKKSHHSS